MGQLRFSSSPLLSLLLLYHLLPVGFLMEAVRGFLFFLGILRGLSLSLDVSLIPEKGTEPAFMAPLIGILGFL